MHEAMDHAADCLRSVTRAREDLYLNALPGLHHG